MNLNLKCKICGIKGGLHDKTWKHKFVPNTEVTNGSIDKEKRIS